MEHAVVQLCAGDLQVYRQAAAPPISSLEVAVSLAARCEVGMASTAASARCLKQARGTFYCAWLKT